MMVMWLVLISAVGVLVFALMMIEVGIGRREVNEWSEMEKGMKWAREREGGGKEVRLRRGSVNLGVWRVE